MERGQGKARKEKEKGIAREEHHKKDPTGKVLSVVRERRGALRDAKKTCPEQPRQENAVLNLAPDESEGRGHKGGNGVRAGKGGK